MFGLSAARWVDLIELVAFIVGGVWALYLYGTSRRGQAKVGIEHAACIHRGLTRDRSVLIVRLLMSNTSNVLWRLDNARATLFDARKLAENGTVRLVPFIEADPFLPVYGDLAEDAADFRRGEPFGYFEGQEITLEPGEQVQTELAFPLRDDKLGLMAMKVWLSGRQRNRSRRPYEWATFFFLDPARIEQEFES